MKFLGIDPGYERLGYAVLEKEGSKISVVEQSVIQTSKKDKFEVRLLELYRKIIVILDKYEIEFCGIEQVLISKNQKTGGLVLQSKGVVLMALAKFQISIHEFSPTSIKKILTGYGKASKKQMTKAIVKMFQLKSAPIFDDAADATAIAFAMLLRSQSKIARLYD